MTENLSINEKIEVLNNLNTQLSDLEKYLNPLLDKDYDSLMKQISPKERVDMNWSLGYTTYSLYYCKSIFILVLLKINNHDPNQHQVKDEMKRIEEVYGRIKELDKKPLPSSNLNIEASERVINNKRKLKGNVPLPELSHLNVNKFK